jgi:hypothetical protein
MIENARLSGLEAYFLAIASNGGVGHDSALARRDDVTGDAAHFSETFAAIGVRRERARCSEHRGRQRTIAKRLHENLRQQFALILPQSSFAPQHHDADWILQS